MKVPYWLQGFLFVPALFGVVFGLEMICPENAVGGGCLSDAFTVPLFMPAVFAANAFSGASIFAEYEMMFIIAYWCAVALLLGFAFDIFESKRYDD